MIFDEIDRRYNILKEYSLFNTSLLTESSNEQLYPVYIILFSNDTNFGKLIRKATGSEYSHATIALDSTMNNMYSFSDIPFTHSRTGEVGFVRESIWSPMFTKNRHFRILVTFVNKEGIYGIQKKIDYFINHYTEYDYNDMGLIQYYLHFKNTKKHDETKKLKWFCSEFVTGMVNAANVSGFENVLQSPGDLKDMSEENINVIDLGKFTIPTFKESELIRKTNKARKEFDKIHSFLLDESFIPDEYDIVEELNLKALFHKEKKKKNRKNLRIMI